MNDDKDTVNYMDSINKASRKRRRKPSFWEQYGILVIGAAVLAVIVVAVVFGGKAVNAVKGKMAAAQAASESASESESAEEASLQAEEESRAKIESESAETDAKIQEVIDSYSNLGIAKVTGYLNIRKDPNEAANVIGTLSDGSACEILETLEGWYKISSGEVEGYASAEYILTGDEAKTAAKDLVKERAYITADNLNIRETRACSILIRMRRLCRAVACAPCTPAKINGRRAVRGNAVSRPRFPSLRRVPAHSLPGFFTLLSPFAGAETSTAAVSCPG